MEQSESTDCDIVFSDSYSFTVSSKFNSAFREFRLTLSSELSAKLEDPELELNSRMPSGELGEGEGEGEGVMESLSEIPCFFERCLGPVFSAMLRNEN